MEILGEKIRQKLKYEFLKNYFNLKTKKFNKKWKNYKYKSIKLLINQLMI